MIAQTLIGQQLARLRVHRGLRMEEAAAAVGLTHARVAAIETGRHEPQEREVAALLEHYGLQDWHERQHLLSLVRGEREPGWYDRPEVPIWLSAACASEDRASLIYSYGPHYLPALLQTRAYAEAAVRAVQHPGATTEQIRTGADLIMRRQEVLRREDGPALWVVLDRRTLLDPPLANVDARLDQIDALIAAAKEPRITVQIARPSTVTQYLYNGAPFTLTRFPERHREDLLALHLLHGSKLISEPALVEDYHIAFARLYISAHPVDATPDVLGEIRALVAA
ncbi:helix-turn-helix transcriptional regulator [Nonomuraea sp. NPDC050310]|uniref:helix-turn-helix domain-containing protein n=1 Tax=Nonomuraea sp. NPDC050310 TaxID=3154935 RepID=UPI00340A23E4